MRPTRCRTDGDHTLHAAAGKLSLPVAVVELLVADGACCVLRERVGG